ncbi:MAG: PfaD family polyunsaturated fatty acid/polyketide biosynthesis protein [Anaerolineaceae bacterium]|jgi:PfaD family protein
MQGVIDEIKVDGRNSSAIKSLPYYWQGDANSIVFEENAIRSVLMNFNSVVMAVSLENRIGLTAQGSITTSLTSRAIPLIGWTIPVSPDTLGNGAFCATYGTRYAYYGGSMANGISSAELVIALGKAGFMGSFGSAGLGPTLIEAAIHTIQQALPDSPYAFNLINSPNEPALEQRAADLYLAHGIHIVEASAYVDLTVPLVLYRTAGLKVDAAGKIEINNHILAKLSRKEVARRFLEPAPLDILGQLVKEKKISELQASLAQQVPMADDITVEADSGGHTDNRPLVGLLPTMLALRDEIQAKYHYSVLVRIGAAGGISTPTSALAAFIMGADYIVTGSINQACVESGATEYTRGLLAQADMADVIMAPAADMFEMGVKVQLLKRGTLFPLRAQKLYELYTRYNSIDDIPAAEREKQERLVFKRDFTSIWDDVVKFFNERDPHQIERAERDPKQKMALIFRWYLGLSSRWAEAGEKGREMDYQIWCGPSMGTFNDWTRPTYLNDPGSRHVVDVALHLLSGAAYLYRLRMLTMQGILVPANLEAYLPAAPLI